MESVGEMLGTQLRHLADMHLQYRPDVEVEISEENREGALIGRGDGAVRGEELRGSIRWALYSGNCAYVYVQAGVEPPEGQHLCTVHPGGVIETEDGAEIWFDAKGYGLRGANASQPHMWTLTMGIQFQTKDERYEWLNSSLGVLVSRFDEQAGRALWHIYLPEAD